MPYDDDMDWQRQFIPEIKQVCANYLIGEAPEEEDQQRNTDLVVLKLDPVRVACRTRRSVGKNGVNYLERYPDEFTIRAGRPSGVQTELQKVLSGWGDYIFYGFAAADESCLAAWFLGDLKVFRLWHHQHLLDHGRAPGASQNNPDGSSSFQAYKLTDLPTSFIVARRQASRREAA